MNKDLLEIPSIASVLKIEPLVMHDDKDDDNDDDDNDDDDN